MNKNSWSELFPTRLSLVVFALYILLFVNQGILVTASQSSNNEYDYNIVVVVLLTEVLKLLASICFYYKDHSIISLASEVFENKKVLLLYCIPAFLYCLYNNLSFVNLSKFDPTTYYLLLQFRVVITAVLFQVIFRKYLSKKQWFSLVLLTLGCMMKQMNFTKEPMKDENQTKKSDAIDFSLSAVFIFVQMICSCLAGVYNEFLLKKPGALVNIYIQNVFMYIDSIFCNILLLLVQGGSIEATQIVKALEFRVLIVMINNAAIGIVTSFFLKTMNSILKTFASALELILTAMLSYVFFSIPIYLNTVLSIVTVLVAVYLYAQNPVTNLYPRSVHKQEDEEESELIMEEVV